MVNSVFICEYLWENKNNYPWEKISDPLYLPLKRGGLVCLPLESPYDIQWSGGKIRVYLCLSVGDKNNHPCGRNIM